MMVVIRRIEAAPGSWPGLTDEIAATVRGLLSQHSDALKTYLSLPSGQIEMRTVQVDGLPFGVIRAARGFEPDDDPYVVIIGPRPGRDRAVVAVFEAARRTAVSAGAIIPH
jgi:hypothetical protein